MYQIRADYETPRLGANTMPQNQGPMAYERYCMLREMNQICREMNNRLGMMQNTLNRVYECTCGRRCR